MVEIFDHFQKNRCLFKCDIHDFDHMIKSTMKELVISDSLYQKKFVGDVRYQGRHSKCSICLQELGFINRLVICYNCCNICIGKKVIIDFGMCEIYTIVHCYNDIFNGYQMIYIHDYNNIFVEFNSEFWQDTKNKVLTHFIDNSPKLKNRFYHVAPITFILSLKDPTSECYVLIHDIILYILKFIY